jgi:hypothetical protein
MLNKLQREVSGDFTYCSMDYGVLILSYTSGSLTNIWKENRFSLRILSAMSLSNNTLVRVAPSAGLAPQRTGHIGWKEKFSHTGNQTQSLWFTLYNTGYLRESQATL